MTSPLTSEGESRGGSLSGEDGQLVARLRAGDEAAFAQLVDSYYAPMLHLAMTFVRDRELAADVVQDAWLAALRGLDSFEGRSSLKTWLCSIVLNIARRRARQESRSVPLSAVPGGSPEGAEPAVDADRFNAAGNWASAPSDWAAIPEQRLLSAETMEVIRATVRTLPEVQRAVIELRDIAGWSAAEVCNALELTETNQRVLLHRARSKVRRALEAYLG